ncbi:MAG: hypothetical protein WC461_02965 [Candidatus Paceibacterota bacterium]
MKKKIKNAIARLLWTPGKIRYILTAMLFVFVFFVMGYGLINMAVKNEDPLGLLVAILGASIAWMFPVSIRWYYDLPDHKIAEAEEALKGCERISEFRPGFELLELAKKTGQTKGLEAWMERFRQYKAAADELHALRVQAVDLPKQIREAEQKRNDLYHGLGEPT